MSNYLSVATVVLELLTNSPKVCGCSVMVGILVPNRIGSRPGRSMSPLSLIMGRGWAGELFSDSLDRPLDPLGSGLRALLAGIVGISLLGPVPEERLDSLPSKVCSCAAICR